MPVTAAARAVGRVRELAAFLALRATITGVYVLSGERAGPPCPLKLATGWDCPLCGSTRMGAALMHGDLPTAFHDNPVVLLAVGGLSWRSSWSWPDGPGGSPASGRRPAGAPRCRPPPGPS